MERASFSINRLLSRMSACIILVLTFATVADVLGRFLFNRPLSGVIEATELGLVLIVYLAFGYTEQFEEHIVIEAAYDLMPSAMKRLCRLLAGTISVITVVIMAWQLYIYAGRMLAGGYYTAVLGIPLYPIVLVASFGSLCYALAIVATMVKSFRGKKGGNAA